MDKNNFAARHLLQRSPLSYMLYPASLIYAGYMLFRRKFLFPSPYRAPFKVISVGNLTSGGSGKTPITIALAKALQDRGFRVVVASRGYRAGWEQRGGMISDGSRLLTDVCNAGDEALMVASSLPGIPVFVGRIRREVLRQVAKLKPDLVILDDAMQHLKVARDLDIVVFDTKVGLGNGWVIPAGYLREPLSALPEKSIILLHSKNGHPAPESLTYPLKSIGHPMYNTQSRADSLLMDGRSVDPQSMSGKSLSLVSAIAHPDSFEASIAALRLSYRTHYKFPDHFAFGERSAMLNILLHDAKANPDELYVCTEKDYAKLQQVPSLNKRLIVLRLETTLDPAFVEKVMTAL